MQFQRTKNKKTSKEWHDEGGLHYRITWKTKFRGVEVTPCYYACVQVTRPDGTHWWDFAWLRRPFRTYKRAVEACKKHRRLWEQFVKLSHAEGNRIKRLQDLDARGRSGGANMLSSLPLWVQGQADESLIRMRFK